MRRSHRVVFDASQFMHATQDGNHDVWLIDLARIQLRTDNGSLKVFQDIIQLQVTLHMKKDSQTYQLHHCIQNLIACSHRQLTIHTDKDIVHPKYHLLVDNILCNPEHLFRGQILLPIYLDGLLHSHISAQNISQSQSLSERSKTGCNLAHIPYGMSIRDYNATWIEGWPMFLLIMQMIQIFISNINAR